MTKSRTPAQRSARTSSAGSVLRRWLSGAGLAGAFTLITASLVLLTGSSPVTFLGMAAYLISWFTVGGVIAGTAIAVQQVLRRPRVVAPLFALGIMVLVGGVLWSVMSAVDPQGEALYGLAVGAPFVVVLISVVTVATVMVPDRYRPRAAIAAVVVSGLITLASLLV